tara:strand:- start:766 stop:885 length:120 start_codon:yes stop_codon:yes gene_type:complete
METDDVCEAGTKIVYWVEKIREGKVKFKKFIKFKERSII